MRIIPVLLALSFTLAAHGSVIQFTDKAEWEAFATDVTTIDFTGFSNGMLLTTQYAHLGVTFLGQNFTSKNAGFLNDGWGLSGPDGTQFVLDTPLYSVAIDHPGVAQFELYSGGELIHTSLLMGGGGIGHFSGLISTIPFDEVYIFKPDPPFNNHVFIDDLHFGGIIPAPGALPLLALALLAPRRRRRAGCRAGGYGCADGAQRGRIHPL